MMAKNIKRMLLVLGLALLLPGVAGAGGGSIDPNGAGTDGGGSIDPNGGLDGAAVCSGDCHATIDPNG